jgi:DNA anti-recombination protein RmuC
MIANGIEHILKVTQASILSEVVCGIILIVFVFGCFFSIKSKYPNFVSYTPALLTSLGIFGTFGGIVIGLMLFDEKDIDGSISLLLSGLKTAFVTSLLGILTSIIFRGLQSMGVLSPKKVATRIESATPEDILAAITGQNQSLESLVTAIGGDGDRSLVSQLKLMRGDVNDNQKLTIKGMDWSEEYLKSLDESITSQKENFNTFSDKLWIKLQDFADTLSKSATETVIEALKQVITDFNQNLTEQFGENFKQLNESVKELVIWQENYKVQIADMTDQYKLGVSSIAATETSVTAISQEAKVIPETMANLKQVMEVNQHQLAELERHLEAFKDMRDKAVEAVPEIRSQIQETVDTISNSVALANKHYETLLTESDTHIQKTTETISESVALANKHYEALLTESDTHIQKTAETISESVSLANKHYETLLTESDTYIKSHIAASNDLLDKFVSNTKEGIDIIGVRLAESASQVEKVITEGAKEFEDKVHQTNGALTSTADHVTNQTEVIKNALKDTTDDLSQHVRDMINGLISDSKDISTTLSDANKSLVTDTSNIRDGVVKSIENMQSRLESSLEDVFTSQSQHMQKVFTNIDAGLKEQVGKTGEAVEKQLGMIDQSMQEELTRSMQILGSNLGTITQKFTTDYKSLVREMTNVINQAA